MIKEQQVSLSPKPDFFPIPNLKPLLQCFNVPEPIIHPPGVDPYAFLISKQCDQEMEMVERISPMDIDPCVVLRTESVVRTCDLTMSEHAGVNLSELSPIVSTTSHSTAHSGVSTLTTVNNMVVTHIPTESDAIIYCEACKVTCIDENAFKRHKEGKTHLKNTQTLPIVSSTSNPAAHSEVTTQPNANNVVVTQIPMEADTFMFCESCKVTCIDDNAFKRHTEGKTHLKNTQTLPSVSTTSHSPALSKVTAQPTVNNVVPKQIQTENGTFIVCDLCKVTCLSENAFKRHKEGKTHLKNTQTLLVVSSTSNSPAHSEVSAQPNDIVVTEMQTENDLADFSDASKVTCVGENAFKKHKEGKTHLKNSQPVVSSTSDSPAHSEVTAQATENIVVVTQIQPDNKNEFNRHEEVKTQIKDIQMQLDSSESKQEKPSSIANDTLDQDHENKKIQDSLQNEALVVNSLFVCSIPDPGCYYQRIVTEDQMNGNLCMDPTSMSKTSGGTQNSHEMWCKICKVSCSSNKCLERHLSGKQHIKNLKLSEQNLTSQPITTVTSMDITPMNKPVEDLKLIKCETVDMDESKPTWCELCKVTCTSNNINRHLTGKKHLKNLQKLGKKPDLPLTPSPLVSSTTKGEVVNPKEVTHCELCGICCTSSEELIKHISGKKHQKILKNSQKIYAHSPTPEAKRTLQDFMNEDIEEGEIVIGERSKRKANDSLASDEDVDTKRQKLMQEEMESGELVTCKVCNEACKGLMAFKCHLGSFEHSSTVMKQINGGSSKQ